MSSQRSAVVFFFINNNKCQCECVCSGVPGYFSVIFCSLYCLYRGLEVSTSHCIDSYRRSCSSNPLLTLKHRQLLTDRPATILTLQFNQTKKNLAQLFPVASSGLNYLVLTRCVLRPKRTSKYREDLSVTMARMLIKNQGNTKHKLHFCFTSAIKITVRPLV